MNKRTIVQISWFFSPSFFNKTRKQSLNIACIWMWPLQWFTLAIFLSPTLKILTVCERVWLKAVCRELGFEFMKYSMVLHMASIMAFCQGAIRHCYLLGQFQMENVSFWKQPFDERVQFTWLGKHSEIPDCPAFSVLLSLEKMQKWPQCFYRICFAVHWPLWQWPAGSLWVSWVIQSSVSCPGLYLTKVQVKTTTL